jgi:protein-disulfide isomerase
MKKTKENTVKTKHIEDINNQETSKFSKYMVPSAIVVAGIFIALAIIVSSRIGNSTNSNTVTKNNSSTQNSSNSSSSGGSQTTVNNIVTVSLGTNPILGNSKKAKVAIVEFGDFQCPFCKEFYNSVFPQIQENYINNGNIIFAFRDYPLEKIHPLALGMAKESRCFGEQGKFWNFVNQMYTTNQDTNTPSVVSGYAKSLGLNMNLYNTCISDNTFQPQISADINAGNKINIQGTPTFVIGKIKNGKVTGQEVLGAYPYSYFQTIINQELS